MKKIIYFSLIIIVCVSCKQEYEFFDVVFDKAVLYYYGRSPIGTTFEVPVKLYDKNKEIASFVFYSYNAELEQGVYSYNEKTYAGVDGTGIDKSYYVDKTFYKGLCKWGGNIITDGYVAVKKESGKYEFIVDVTDNTGKRHKGRFNSDVITENTTSRSEIDGIFVTANIDGYWSRGKYTLWIVLEGGDKFYYISVYSYVTCAEVPADIVGVYEIDNDMFQYWLSNRKGGQLMSCQITISRTNKPCRYKVDVDLIDDTGYRLQGSFDGGFLDKYL